jgi:hypothetical protein
VGRDILTSWFQNIDTFSCFSTNPFHLVLKVTVLFRSELMARCREFVICLWPDSVHGDVGSSSRVTDGGNLPSQFVGCS